MANDEVRIKIKIDSNSQELVLMKQQVQDLGKSFTDADSFANTFMKRINIAGHIYAGFQILNSTVGDLARRGLEVNKEFQKLSNSLTMSSAVMMANTDVYGNAITITEKYKIAQMDAAKTTEMLQKININTPHTMKETTQIYDSMYFSMKKAGASSKDMVEITEKLSIAAGNKVPFDAFLSAMDGIATGTVEANSEMGRFLSSVGLSNEEIKNSSNVVQLFKDKLSGFQVIEDFDTKMSNLTNSTDTFAKNLMKIPFDYLESKLPKTAKMFDSWAKSVNEINIYLSNASSLSTYDELMNKQYQLLGQISKVKNDKFMWDSDQKEKLSSLNGELETVFTKLSEIRALEDKAKNIGTKFDSKPIDDLVNKTLNPYGTKLDEINKKWQNNFENMQKNGIDTSKVYAAWTKEIADLDKEEADKKEKASKENQKLLKDQEKSAETLNKALLDISQIGMSEYDKGLISITEKTNEWAKAGVSENEILKAKIKLEDELKSKTLYQAQKEDLSYYERKIQLMDDSIGKELELQGIAYANKILEIEASTKSIAEKDKLIAKETELFNLTIQSKNLKHETEFQDTMSNFYDDMLDSQLALNSAVYDFGGGFDGVASKVGNLSKNLAAMSSLELTNKKEASELDKKYIKQFDKYAGDVEKTKLLEQQYTKDTAILNEQNIQAQINGYANIAGAMSGMFEQGTKEAATFQMIESGLAVVSGVRAILSQGSGDPYTAFARMAAMTASVMSLLQSAKIAFNIGSMKTTETSDYLSSLNTNEGTGTVLGDTAAQSESIVQSMEILKDFAQPQYETLLSMNKHLSNIAIGVSGVGALLIQDESYAMGYGYKSTDSGWKNKVSADTLAKLNIFDNLTGSNIMGGIFNKAMAGLFGKTSVTSKMKDSGMYFADQLLTEATKNFIGSAYQTIETTTTTKSWFDKSTSISSKTKMQNLSNQTNSQFTMIIDNLYKTTLLAGDALDTATSTVENSLSNFVVSLGKISLKKKSGDEIQKTIEAVFGRLGDQIAGTAFPLLNQFQTIGEGLFTTMTRVAAGMEEAEFYIGRLGKQYKDLPYWEIINKRGNVGFEALLQSIEKVEIATYPLNNNLLSIIENLDSTAEELYGVYTALDELRDRLIFLGQSAQGISSSMIKGAGSADSLVDGFNDYFENFLDENEQLKYQTEQLTDEFQKLGLALPISKDSFKSLLSSLDLTSVAGQELYGRLIILSESFADVADATTASIEELTTSLDELTTNSFDSFISSLDEVGNTLVNIKNTALGFVQGFTTSGNASLKDQLIAYNKLRGQFSSYFDENGIIKAGINQDTVSDLYSSMTSLATSISGKDDLLKNSLIGQFESDIFSFDSSTDVLRVNIVEGLSKLEGLNEVQKNKLIEASRDGKLTNSELDNIAGLTATQKDNIIKFASNSDLFSTEGTLSNLETYAKAQLDIIQKQNDAETSNISAQTFSYGDYIGKQEQIDISKTLGVSYTSSKDFIEKLQDLSISTDLKKDLSSLLGYGGYEYDLNKASQITSLSQYLNPNVASTLNQIKDESSANIEQRNIFEAARSDFYKRLTTAENTLSILNESMASSWSAYSYWDEKVSKTDNGSSNYDRYKAARQAAAQDIWINLPPQINAYTSLLNNLYDEKALKGYFTGGYTGDIPINAIAGFVHGGEHVLDANITSQVNQIGSVADMVNQYTNTNFYQKMNDTFSSMKNEISNLVKITIQQANELKKLRKEVELGGTL